MTYWLDLFTGVTWNEFRNAGSNVTGFRETRWKTIQRIKEGDIFLCYLTGVSRFVGLLEVTGKPFQDDTPIWKDVVFPCRLQVNPLLELDPEYGVSVHDLRDRLSCFLKSEASNAWTGAFRGSPAKWSQSDGDAVVEVLQHAKAHPKKLPTDPKKLAQKPRAFIGKDKKPVTIPDDDELPLTTKAGTTDSAPTEHTEIQALLLRLGADMGFDVWVGATGSMGNCQVFWQQ